MTQTTQAQLANWFMNGEVGASSKCIAKHLSGQEYREWDYPRDSSDLGRCIKLLDAVPEFRSRISEMASAGKYWAALVPHWGELEACQSDHMKCGALINKLTRPIEKDDKNVVRIDDGCSIRFGV
jgi:hypothetical protein